MRLVDADEVKKALTGWDTDPTDEEIEYTIDHLPTIEATPVVHGRWMLESTIENCNGGHTHYCDRCHDYYTTEADSLYFCPRCSAKMIGVEQPGRNGWKLDFVDGEWKQVWGVINERFMKTRTEEDFPNYGAKMDGGVSDG